VNVRPATADDAGFIRLMFVEAAFWNPDEERPPLEQWLAAEDVPLRYFEGWGREGDEGFIAEEDGSLIGAAWFRVFSKEEPAYGFVAESIPEIAIGLVPEARGRGIGTALLSALLDRAAELGYAATSLSVFLKNPALRLYERLGFEKVEDDDEGYRTMKAGLGAR